MLYALFRNKTTSKYSGRLQETTESCPTTITHEYNINSTIPTASNQDLSLIDQDLYNYDCPFPYKALPLLGTKKVGSRYVIVAKSWVNHYGNTKLVVKLHDGLYYQAGKDLEQKDRNRDISIPQNFLIHKTKVDVSSRRREAVCILTSSVYGDL